MHASQKNIGKWKCECQCEYIGKYVSVIENIHFFAACIHIIDIDNPMHSPKDVARGLRPPPFVSRAGDKDPKLTKKRGKHEKN